MMRSIVASSLKFRRLIVAVAAGLLVFGVTQLPHTPVDQLPEFGPTMVEVRTEALGLSAVEVEQLITVPLEQDLLNGIAFVESIHSESLPGMSSVVLMFEPGTPLLDARQLVAEKVAEAAVALPGVSAPPQMLQPYSSTGRVLTVRLSSDEVSAIDMSVKARWVIAPRLLGVPGVANVSIWGQRDRQLQVLVDPKRLQDADVTLQQIISTTGNGLWVSPLTFLEASTPGTAGFIDTPTQRLGIRHELPIKTAGDLAQIPIDGAESGASGQSLQLGDVTDVVEDHQPLIGDALFQNGTGLLLVVEKFPGAHTAEVTEGIEEALTALEPGLPGIRTDTSLFRPADYIEHSTNNLFGALAIGGILLLLALVLMLFEWRAIVTSAAAIAVALVVAGAVLYVRDTPANLMILAGLVLGLGIVIDDAIVDVTNLKERLRQHREDGKGTPAWRSVLDASMEMRSALLFATLVVLATLVPAFFLEGQPGAFLPDMAASYILAIVASMLVALTVTPALGMILLPGGSSDGRGSPVVRWLQGRFDGSLGHPVRNVRWGYGVAGVAVLVGLLTLPFLDASSAVTLRESDLLIHFDAPPGTSLPAMNEVTAAAVDELGQVAGVRNVSAHVGRAVHSDQVVNVNSGEIWVSLDPAADHEGAIASMERVLSGYPEISHDVLTYTEERTTDVLQGTDEDVVVRIYGADHEILRGKAEEVQTLLASIDGIQDPTVELAPTEPTLAIEVDLDKAAEFGVKPGDVRRSAAILLSGLAVGNLFEEQKVFDVVVWGTPEIREDATDVENLLIDTPTGEHVRLGDVADVTIEDNLTVIRHEAVSNYLDVSATIAGRDVGAVVDDVEAAVDGVEFPLEHHAEIRGSFAAEQASRSRQLGVVIAAAIAVFLLLQAAFTSWRLAVLAFVTLPIALVGGLVAALVAGGTLSLGSYAGLAAVLGIAARNGILMIRRYQSLEREGLEFGDELVALGTRERLAAVVTSAVALIATMIPLAFAGDVAGLEIVRPMAVVMLGGAFTSTVLAVVVLPSLYRRHGFVAKRDTVAEDLLVVIPEAESDVATVPGT
ncbi:MAG TPA: efflux RND transporter permease subunit [Actinomycetota bacterium]|nr:efflux RND transporter permease subunit [Actinomycetota bacterium]